MTRDPPRPRSDYRAWHSIPTRWADNDVYGHVNNVVYYAWFDTAVNAQLVRLGLLDIEHGNPIGLVVETRCRYFAPVSFPQVVEAGVRVARLGTSSVTYEVGIFIEDSAEAVAEGHFVHVYVDREKRRPMPLPENWRGVLASLA
jgi:acyl-CoA thioester hydrolase